MTPEEKSLCIKEGCTPAAVQKVADVLCCSIEDAIPRYIAKKRAEKNLQRLVAEETQLKRSVKALEKMKQNIKRAPQTAEEIKKSNRNLSVQNDILFNVYGRVMEAIESKGTDEEKVDKIKTIITNSQIAVYEVGLTNPRVDGGDDE